MSNELMYPEDILAGVKSDCLQLISTHNDIDFNAEQNYAIQLLYANDYALKIARQNPASVQNAVKNASAIGISLNPASKHAYLVPRKGSICLDISYMGMLHLAMSTGSIEWGQAKLVYANDHYENQGIDKAPIHKYSAFGGRGEVVGAYCTVKTSTGAYLTEEMDIEQLNAIRARSESYNRVKNGKPAPSGPWVTDCEEMYRKTVVKRGSKYWPKVDRLDTAIDYLNTDGGEGIQQQPEEPQQDVTPVNDETLAKIDEYLEAQERDKEKALSWLSKQVKRELISFADLRQHEANSFLKTLQSQGAAA